jgi:hypothetical protein
MAAMEYLQRAGLAVEVVGGNLRLSPADRITDTVRVFVRNHKPALLAEAKVYRPGDFQENTALGGAAAAWWRSVLLDLRCTQSHLLACGVIDEADIASAALEEYFNKGITPEAFACALRQCEGWRLSP